MTKEVLIFETAYDTYIHSDIIGEGGSGRVYVVTNSAGEEYALKCLKPEHITSERLKRFKNEILFCQNCRHSNVVKVIDTGAIFIKRKKCPFYIMRRYSGTLRTQMKKIAPDRVLPLFANILDGVEAAHLEGVWHRDLKPENIFFEQRENSMLVADFGIAHFEEEEIYTAVETKGAERLANFQYSAPEQRVRNSKVDHKADIFALGLILNEMFTGEILQGTGYTKISKIAENYSYLDDLVEFMTQQNPSNRPESIKQIKMELIGRNNAFIALQKYDEYKKKIVVASEPPQFEPISIISFDYYSGKLEFKLNKNVPPDWALLFKNPRGGYSFTAEYSPTKFMIHGDTVTIGVFSRYGEKNYQEIVDILKDYINAANQAYAQLLRELALKDNRRQEEEFKSQVAEAERRKNILANIKI